MGLVLGLVLLVTEGDVKLREFGLQLRQRLAVRHAERRLQPLDGLGVVVARLEQLRPRIGHCTHRHVRFVEGAIA